MLPYFGLDSFIVGPITIHVWGLMVAAGILVAVWFIAFLAKKYLYAPAVIYDLAIWVLLSAFILARLFHVVFYDLSYYLLYPLDIFKIWQGGMSSTGGFFGAALAIWLFAKYRHFNFKELLPYLDFTALGLWLGWGIGRLGCFFTHLHPGRRTNFWLAVNYPGGTRFDLGLMESMLGFILFAIFYLLFKRLIKMRWGLVAGWSAGSYALVRFWLDFLRATDLPNSDARYGALTPAQWAMLAIIGGLIFLGVYGKIMSSFAKASDDKL